MRSKTSMKKSGFIFLKLFLNTNVFLYKHPTGEELMSGNVKLRVRIFAVFDRPKWVQDYYVLGAFEGSRLIGAAFFPGVASLDGAVKELCNRSQVVDQGQRAVLLTMARKEMNNPIQLCEMQKFHHDWEEDYKLITADVLAQARARFQLTEQNNSHMDAHVEYAVLCGMLRVRVD